MGLIDCIKNPKVNLEDILAAQLEYNLKLENVKKASNEYGKAILELDKSARDLEDKMAHVLDIIEKDKKVITCADCRYFVPNKATDASDLWCNGLGTCKKTGDITTDEEEYCCYYDGKKGKR